MSGVFDTDETVSATATIRRALEEAPVLRQGLVVTFVLATNRSHGIPIRFAISPPHKLPKLPLGAQKTMVSGPPASWLNAST